MKILIISSEFPPGPGGIGTHAYHLASEFSVLGERITVLTPQDYVSPEEVVAFNRRQPFEIISLQHLPTSIIEGIGRFNTLQKVVRSKKPNAILASGRRAVWLASFLSKANHIPTIAVGHGTEFGYDFGWQKKLTSWSFNRADGVVNVSQYTLQQMRKMGIAPKICRVIPNGADDSVFQPLHLDEIENFKKEHGFKQHQIILSVGNVTMRKGHDMVIRSLPLILKDFPNVDYVVIGLPTMANEWMKLAVILGVSDHVHFWGRVSVQTLVAAYNACDVFVMTSRHNNGDFEGFGIAAIEAALCGKPAIVTKGSGLEEAVIDHETGLFVTENSHEEVAEAVVSLLENQNTTRQYGINARQRVLSNFTWKNISKQYLNILQELICKESFSCDC